MWRGALEGLDAAALSDRSAALYVQGLQGFDTLPEVRLDARRTPSWYYDYCYCQSPHCPIRCCCVLSCIFYSRAYKGSWYGVTERWQILRSSEFLSVVCGVLRHGYNHHSAAAAAAGSDYRSPIALIEWPLIYVQTILFLIRTFTSSAEFVQYIIRFRFQCKTGFVDQFDIICCRGRASIGFCLISGNDICARAPLMTISCGNFI